MLLYRYELRQGDVVVSAGRFARSQTLVIGDRVEIGGRSGIVRAVEPVLGEQAQRLVVQLLSGAEQIP